MEQESRYYEHSGEIGSTGPVCLLVFGVPGAIVAGVIYACITAWIFNEYVNVLMALAVGFVPGFLVGQISKFGKVRNADFVLVMGVILGLASVYAGWVAWLYVYSKYEILVISPFRVLAVMRWLAGEGPWSIMDMTPKGVVLYAIWAFEAVVIVGISAVVARMQIKGDVYCEQCGRWVDKYNTVSLLEPIREAERLREQLEQADYSYFDTLKTVDVESSLFSTLSVCQCSECRKLSLLTAGLTRVVEDKNGGTELKETPIVENLYIDPDTYEVLKDRIAAANAEQEEEEQNEED